MCMENKGLTKKQFVFDLVAIGTNIIRSIGFNFLMFFFGFILGLGTLQLISHVVWTKNANYECVQKLEKHLAEQRELDECIDRELRNLKLTAIHDKVHN